MATSPNFGWLEPDNTDLVKNGALAIRTAVNAIDSSLAELKGGTTGQVLSKTSATDMDFTWTTVASSGRKIVQIVTGSTNTQTGSASTTYADTTLTATITPTLSTSQILVFVSQSGCQKYATNTSMALRLVRGSTTILQMATIAGGTGSTADLNWGTIAATYLDSPATTSATTYKTEFNSTNGTTQATVQHGGSTSTIVLMEVSA
jgi:hypothetical protein